MSMTNALQQRRSEVDLKNPRVAEVWRQLETVCDPELDEPVTDMGFIEGLEVDENGTVGICFRLPTYWCSANFAFLMATDMRHQVEKLDWVSRARVTLKDHMFEEQVNVGVNDGRSFREIFADLAPDQGLDEIREKFRQKAFQRRQEVMLLGLRRMSYSDDDIVKMTLQHYDRVRFNDQEEARQQRRYRDIIGELELANSPGDLAFCSYGGGALTAQGLDGYLATLRAVRINMEFSGALCRGLLNTRYKELKPDDDEPTLVDFILDRVPPRNAGKDAVPV